MLKIFSIVFILFCAQIAIGSDYVVEINMHAIVNLDVHEDNILDRNLLSMNNVRYDDMRQSSAAYNRSLDFADNLINEMTSTDDTHETKNCSDLIILASTEICLDTKL